jgi:hypothetical protein
MGWDFCNLSPPSAVWSTGKGFFVDLLFTKLVFTLRLESDSGDPYALFSLKSCFREAFRETVCRSHGQCSRCSDRTECPFQAVFGQELAADPAALKRHQKPPLPFLFHIPLLPGHGCTDRDVELGLVIIGYAMNYLPEFCSTLMRLLRGPREDIPSVEVVRIDSEGCSGFRSLVVAGQGPLSLDAISTISADDLVAMNTLSCSRLGLRVMTPLRIQLEGRFMRRFSFSPFIRTLLRRVSSLAYYYYGSALEMDFQRLARISDSIGTLDESMQWAAWKKGPLEGVVGSGILCGDLTDFHPALLLGTYLSCGKGAAFGLGRYELFAALEGRGGNGV